MPVAPTVEIILDELKIEFIISSMYEVVQHPYRTKRVHEVFMEIPRPAASGLEEKLAERAGKDPDNHTVYEIVTPRGAHLYLMFTDLEVRVGLTMEDRLW